MAFDQSTRNRLARFVGDARSLLTEEFTRQLQHEYGIDPANGEVTAMEKLTALDDARRETARILRETISYYQSQSQALPVIEIDRILREQAFTVLNRLCALRMAEARGIILEAVAQGYRSKGFQLFARLASSALGETGDAYRVYLFSLFDELAVELPPLFDRFSPQGRLFPRESALLKLLDLLNDPELEQLWAEDETIGWIYQYFNSKEERQAMRAASQAPRNSRELAVRNQFFTPRYVVEFLTDNTLGRIWYEMTRGETILKNTCRYLMRRPNEIFLNEGVKAPEPPETEGNLSQEELLRQPVYIPHRPLKDPREIKMLDPACGSMHFGLYAFDLYEQIYIEAWGLEERLGLDALWCLADLAPLHQVYPDREAFLRDVPRLIVERNIHGIDIDPRAVQIAGLSLWLRAQKSWQAQGVKSSERPQICKSNIVCAEPMPGDRAMLEEFLGTLKEERLQALMRKALPGRSRLRATKAMAEALAKLVRTVWQEMELAGEAGSLLKIEETLRDAITAARKESEEKAPLFRMLEYGLDAASQTENGSSGDFWAQAEALVLAALQEYAEQAASGQNFRRRLFTGDAVQGFAFIELCRKRYDTIVMNPPFGEASRSIVTALSDLYPSWNQNLLCAFIESAIHYLSSEGFVGSVIDKTATIKTTYEAFRREILFEKLRLQTQINLGWGILDDANVEVAAIIVSKEEEQSRNVFFDISSCKLEDKADKLIQTLENLALEIQDTTIFYCEPQNLPNLPNAVIAFDFPLWFQRLFKFSPSLRDTGFTSFVGHSFKSDRHFRLLWEIGLCEQINFNQTNWAWVFNGGEYSPFYNPERTIVQYGQNGNAVANDESVTFRSIQLHGKPGIGYGKRGDFIDSQVLNTGHVFTVEGEGVPLGSDDECFYYAAFLTSHIFSFGINLYCGQHKYPGYVNIFPSPMPTPQAKQRIVEKAKNIWQIKRAWQGGDETDVVFMMPHLFSTDGTLSDRVTKLLAIEKKCNNDINTLMNDIDLNFEKIFGLRDQAILQVRNTANRRPKDRVGFDLPDYTDGKITHFIADAIQYAVGCIFGRWDIRYVIKPKNNLHIDVLQPPSRYANGALIEKIIPENYPLPIAWNGILVDDQSNRFDIYQNVEKVFSYVFGNSWEHFERDICERLKVSGLSEYLNSSVGFFFHHINRYKKNHRIAPVYWPLSTPSGSYTIWLFYHRLNDQTLFTCVNDFVDPKLQQVTAEATRLRQKTGRSAANEKELERLSDLERELKDFRAELLRVAAFWKPNLNDGVEITAAPLWRLFQHKPWQKRLKETWGKLEAGDYDWAHLAYSIWPERVREKCKADKSLAIAHDLEQLYVEPKTSRKKKKVELRISDFEEMGTLLDE